MNTPQAPTQRNERYWSPLEIAFRVVTASINTVASSITVWMDNRRVGHVLAPWEPVVWEASSNLVLQLPVPAVVWFTRRLPLHWDTWRRHLPWHVVGSVVFSLFHVIAMVALRKLAYTMQGETYDFGVWRTELVYEYLKDVRVYALFVLVIEDYRFVRRRLQGEARILDAPDVGPPLESLERPERFLLRKLGREFLVAAADVEWLQASGNYVNLRMGGHVYPLRSTLAALEEKLDTGDARVHLKDKTVLPCSRRHRDLMRTPIQVPA